VASSWKDSENVSELRPVESPPAFHIAESEAIVTRLPPVRWLCQSIRLAAGAPTLVAGYGYSGKSVAMQSLCLAVATGRELWGRFVTRQGRVLHLDYEQGRRITFDRYQRMMVAEGIGEEEIRGTLSVGVLPSCGLTGETLKRLGEGRSLVVVDSWRAAHPGIDENSSDVRKTLDSMTTASEVTGCLFAVLHHTRKPQKDSQGGAKMAIRGSSGFYDGCQTIYLFDGETVGRPIVTLEKDRIGGQSLEPFALTVRDTDEGGLEVRHASEEGSRKKAPAEAFSETLALLVQLVKRRPGMSASEMAEITGKAKSHVLAAVQSLTNAGDLVKQGNGPSTRYYTKDNVPNAPF
jgi:AAA domain